MNIDFKEAADKKVLDATTALWNEVKSSKPSPSKIIEAVDNGANLNQTNERRFTPLLTLAINQHMEALTALLGKGALVSTFFMDQQEAAEFVRDWNDRDDIYELLIKHNEPDIEDARIIREFRENVWARRSFMDGDMVDLDDDAPKPPSLRGVDIETREKTAPQAKTGFNFF